MTEDLRALERGLCNEKEQAKCEDEFGDNLEWACENCEKKRAEDLHPYTNKLLRIRMLRDAGYPLKKNDLSYEEWLDLGRLEQCLKALAPLK